MKPVNPLKRLRQEAGLTIAAMTQRGAGSRVFILNSEAGVYSEPPERYFAALNETYSYLDYEEIKAEYRDWQRLTRLCNYGTLRPEWLHVDTVTYTPHVHPFKAWRLYSGITSRVRPSHLFCVHPAILSRWETRPWELASVPSSLSDALIESGYDLQLLARLNERWVEYKSHLSSQTAFKPQGPDSR